MDSWLEVLRLIATWKQKPRRRGILSGRIQKLHIFSFNNIRQRSTDGRKGMDSLLEVLRLIATWKQKPRKRGILTGRTQKSQMRNTIFSFHRTLAKTNLHNNIEDSLKM
jgi:hypothetical protein